MKTFKGKAIYNPSGKAGEYSKWACNFYNGCSAKCMYCYNRHGLTAKVLGADVPTLKSKLINPAEALKIFKIELVKNADDLRKHGLFFSFVSDPCLKETFELNFTAWLICDHFGVPVKILTKQTWWIYEFIRRAHLYHLVNNRFAIGFTLTGHDELEPGAAPNGERIVAMKTLKDEGFRTWASIEPTIDVESSIDMVDWIRNYVDLVKIGLESGRKYESLELVGMMPQIDLLARTGEFKVYYKDSFLKQAKVSREELPDYCVTRDYNIFHENR